MSCTSGQANWVLGDLYRNAATFGREGQMADVKEKFKAMATPTVGSTAADFARLIDTETKMWGEVGRATNVKVE